MADTFLSYGQIGVGVKGGLEAAIHGLCKLIMDESENDDFCCIKVDMKNAFNECRPFFVVFKMIFHICLLGFSGLITVQLN